MPENVVRLNRLELGDEEIHAAVDVLRSGQLRAGQHCEEFERQFATSVGASHAVAVSSGTAALHVAYLALLEPGDEVLVPDFTFIATASMVAMTGAIPVFVDIDRDTFTLDVDDARRKVTSKTRAIAPVHLFGHPCDVGAIRQFAEEHQLKVVWDAAQAHGAVYRGQDIGTFGDITCFSFYPTKNMTTGEGGLLTTSDSELAERCRLIRSHGQSEKYFHTLLGLNYRLTDVAAAIGLVQLRRLPAAVMRRREIAAILSERITSIPGLQAPVIKEETLHAFNQYTIRADWKQMGCTREEFRTALREHSVESGVHYPRPLHMQPVFAHTSTDGQLLQSISASDEVLSLPVHNYLTDREIERTAEAVTLVASQFSASVR